MAGPNEVRTTSATAITVCVVLKVAAEEPTRVLHQENAFSDLLVQFLALRSTRTQAISSISYSITANGASHEPSC